jgi:hypothetical protein
LDDNARSHTANQTLETDLTPSDFHVFGPKKEALRGRRFSSDEEVIGAVQN